MAKKKNSGFSLIEVVIAVAILGLLITPILTQIVQTSNTSRKAKERQAAVENAEYVTNFIQRTDKAELDSSSSAGIKDINITAYTKKQDVFCKLVDSDGNDTGVTVKYNAYIYNLDNIKLGPKLSEYTRQAILDDLSSNVLAAGYSIVYDKNLYTSNHLDSNGYKVTNEGSIVKYDTDGLVSEIVCTPSISTYTYVNPNKISLGFIQDLDSTKVAIIQGIASNFDAQVSEDIFAQKMNTLRDNDIDEWENQVGSMREDGVNVFSNDETACRLLYISIRAVKDGSTIKYYEVTCDACYYDKYSIKGYKGTAKLKYNVFAKKFYTTKSPDIYLIYEPYVPDSSAKAYAYNDYIEVYNDEDTAESKLYLIKPDNNQLKGTDYVEAAGDTKKHYNTKMDETVTPVNINIQVALASGEEASTKDLMTIFTNLDVNYVIDGHKQFSTNDLIRKADPTDTNNLDTTKLAELRKMPWPDYIVKSDRLPNSNLKHISEDTNTSDRLFTITVVMKSVDGNMDDVRYTAGKGVD